jgi:hypothetical protein
MRAHDIFNQVIAKAHHRSQPPAPIERPPAERTAKSDGRRWNISRYRWMLKIIALSWQRPMRCALDGIACFSLYHTWTIQQWFHGLRYLL